MSSEPHPLLLAKLKRLCQEVERQNSLRGAYMQSFLYSTAGKALVARMDFVLTVTPLEGIQDFWECWKQSEDYKWYVRDVAFLREQRSYR